MYPLLRQLLFALPPETAHQVSLDAVAAGERLGLTRFIGDKVPNHTVAVMGLDFPNPVGLSAGLDKNGDFFNGLGSLGFGFIEIGTVTPRAQPGNPKPRMFRLPEHHGIINRLGFNNLGVDYLVERVKRRRYSGVLGINIGKNLATPVDKAMDDYLLGMRRVYAHADYIAVNISSPNTPGLRDLQQGGNLAVLLGGLRREQERLADQQGHRVPLAVKIAPDLTNPEIEDVAKTLVEQRVDGVIATNTTVSRAGVADSRYGAEAGGLSGAPLLDLATERLEVLSRAIDGAIPIIGVGGICSGEDAAEKIKAGASLVQIYTGFIYRGPRLIREAVDAIASSLRFEGP